MSDKHEYKKIFDDREFEVNLENTNILKACSDKEQNTCRKCETTELIKNGGFEVPGTEENTFKFWTIEVVNPEAELANIVATDDAYEGVVAAQFKTEESNQARQKKARIFQDVNVTPGCLYRLSFAENLEAERADFEFGELTARVFYTDNEFNEFDLIKVFIRIDSGAVADVGYTFHQKVAAAPVPNTVSAVTVEFSFNIKDVGAAEQQPDDEWMIDGVSLRSEFAIPIG
jgi:hypothetical protein